MMNRLITLPTFGLLLVGLTTVVAQPAAQPPRFSPEMQEFVKSFKPGGQDFTGQAKVLAPAESIKRFVAAEGYAVELVASEPLIRQPIDLKFDADACDRFGVHGQAARQADQAARQFLRLAEGQGLPVSDFSRNLMQLTEKELSEERDAVSHLLP